MKTLILQVLVGIPCFGSAFFLRPGEKCPELPLARFYDDNILDTCKEKQTPHCLMDKQCRHIVKCLEAATVPKGRCPVYNSMRNEMETRECSGEKCPNVDFPSPAVVKFDGCFQETSCKEREEL